MVRRLRHRKMKAAKRRQPAPDAQGFDYGVGFGVVLLGDVEFPSLLSKANILGLVYGLDHDSGLGAQVPFASLIAGSPKPLVEAFEHFSKWAETTDGDAVDLCWVFLRDGGYLLGLTPEAHRLQHRCTGFARHSAVRLTTAPVWVKRMDTCGPETLKFRKYCEVLGAPFLFGAAQCSVASHDLRRAKSSDIKPIKGIRPLRKVSATFVDQCDVLPNTLPWVALQTVIRDRTGVSQPPAPNAETWFQDRRSALGAYFPVTLERIRAWHSETGELGGLFERYAPWQVEQAICNVLLSSDIQNGRPHYAGIHAEDLPDVIGRHLDRRVELADGRRGRLRAISLETVERQIRLDSMFLMVKPGCNALEDTTNIQASLEAAGLAEPRTSLTE